VFEGGRCFGNFNQVARFLIFFFSGKSAWVTDFDVPGKDCEFLWRLFVFVVGDALFSPLLDGY
jgi:hypothetical protein